MNKVADPTVDIADWVRYNHAVRELYFESIAELPWNEVIEPKGISFDSMRNVFIHLTLVEDRWINYTIPGRFKDWIDPIFDDYTTFNQLQNYMIAVKNSTEQFLKNLTIESIKRYITIPWGNKADTSISIETALSHMVMEDLVHYGELSAMLWQMNKEAPYLSFWRYMYNKEHLTP
jgi:uncharacterized damage-inducible protein DinB